MSRRPNTDKNGNAWTEQVKLAVWNKGNPITEGNFPPSIWRWDKCGLVMKYSDHGDRNSDYGWEIDHIHPVSNNGDDHLGNLQPLNWRNNAAKSDHLNWTCPKRFSDIH